MKRWGILGGAFFLVLPSTALLAQLVLAPYAWFMVSIVAKRSAALLVFVALTSFFSLQEEEDDAPRTLTRSNSMRMKLRGVAVRGLPGLLGNRPQEEPKCKGNSGLSPMCSLDGKDHPHYSFV